MFSLPLDRAASAQCPYMLRWHRPTCLNHHSAALLSTCELRQSLRRSECYRRRRRAAGREWRAVIVSDYCACLVSAGGGVADEMC